MSVATMSVNPKVKAAFVAYCQKNGLFITKKLNKLLIMDLYKAGYDVRELIEATEGANKPLELQKRENLNNKLTKEESNGSV